jgi:hypothetical protein
MHEKIYYDILVFWISCSSAEARPDGKGLKQSAVMSVVVFSTLARFLDDQ